MILRACDDVKCAWNRLRYLNTTITWKNSIEILQYLMMSGTYAKADAIWRSDTRAIHKENNASARSNFCIIYESEKGVKVVLNQAMELVAIGARASAACNFLIKSHKLFTFHRNLRLKVTLCAAPLKACECAERVRVQSSERTLTRIHLPPGGLFSLLQCGPSFRPRRDSPLVSTRSTCIT
jgi:hypothetical protein